MESPQHDIILTTLNAKYAHASFGLRYLMANLGELRPRAIILEFDITQRPLDIVESILARQPKIVGVGVYIWNAEQALRVVADLKRIAPGVIVVLGGPEVSHETDRQEIVALADFVITGEADIAFAELCEKLLNGRRPLNKIIPAELPEFAVKKPVRAGAMKVDAGGSVTAATLPIVEGGMGGPPMSSPTIPPKSEHVSAIEIGPKRVLELPYDLYDDQDIAHRVIYVEASRGCPFHCEFCLSSLDVPVRNVPLETFLPAMDRLLARGVKHFKFVDRTFNLNLNISRAILDFFWQRYEPGLFLHFEMIPDRLPDALREPIQRFPAGALQFEVGVQTFNDAVSQRISRRQDNEKLADNLRFLREKTGVHVHADLIVGLPGEDLDSFATGFDRLLAMGPQEIQVGILKRLRGTPIIRHDAEWGMVYSPHPPYEVLRTNHLDFPALQRLRRFSRFWDLLANSGNFRSTTPMLWETGQHPSPFRAFLSLSDWLFARFGRNHAIGLPALAESLFRYLIDECHNDPRTVAENIWRDYQRGGRSDRPEFLKAYIPEPDRAARQRSLEEVTTLRRQARHLA